MLLALLWVSGGDEQVITHILDCRGDLNQYTDLLVEKPDQYDICAPVNMPHMATFHNDAIGSVWIPPLSSACLSHDTSHWGIRGWLIHYPSVHLYTKSGVLSNNYDHRATSVYWVPWSQHAVCIDQLTELFHYNTILNRHIRGATTL
jgi:hypothetical protein